MSGKIDWLKLEQDIKGCLRVAASYVDNPAATQNDLALLLADISDAVGYHTGRGFVIDRKALTERFPDTHPISQEHP